MFHSRGARRCPVRAGSGCRFAFGSGSSCGGACTGGGPLARIARALRSLTASSGSGFGSGAGSTSTTSASSGAASSSDGDSSATGRSSRAGAGSRAYARPTTATRTQAAAVSATITIGSSSARTAPTATSATSAAPIVRRTAGSAGRAAPSLPRLRDADSRGRDRLGVGHLVGPRQAPPPRRSALGRPRESAALRPRRPARKADEEPGNRHHDDDRRRAELGEPGADRNRDQEAGFEREPRPKSSLHCRDRLLRRGAVFVVFLALGLRRRLRLRCRGQGPSARAAPPEPPSRLDLRRPDDRVGNARDRLVAEPCRRQQLLGALLCADHDRVRLGARPLERLLHLGAGRVRELGRLVARLLEQLGAAGLGLAELLRRLRLASASSWRASLRAALTISPRWRSLSCR